jgi:hypothetical protein
MNIDRPSVREADSSTFLVRAMTSILAADCTPVIQILRPFSRQPSSPSAAAKVLISSVLVPASGSVSAMQQLISPLMIFGSSSARICSLPKREIETPPKIGLIMNSCPTVEPPPVAARLSTISAISSMPSPLPPCSVGSATPHRPASHTARQYSAGEALGWRPAGASIRDRSARRPGARRRSSSVVRR